MKNRCLGCFQLQGKWKTETTTKVNAKDYFQDYFKGVVLKDSQENVCVGGVHTCACLCEGNFLCIPTVFSSPYQHICQGTCYCGNDASYTVENSTKKREEFS